MSADQDDQRYMAMALQLARRGRYTTDPNPCVGCVIVLQNHVIGSGYHHQAGTDHAERIALADAGIHAYGATAYVTLEPCCHQGRTPPCTDALIAAGIQRVVVAMQDPNPQVAGQGIQTLNAAGISTEVGLLETEARALNPGFIQRMTLQKPFVRLKLAMSLDGRTAMASGESQWITGPAAREDVQHLRATSSAILTGIGTVLADDPALNVRLTDIPTLDGSIRQPLRIVLDSHGRLPPTAQLLQSGNSLIVTGPQIPAATHQALCATGAELLSLPLHQQHISLSHLIPQLARRALNSILIECGATLAGAALQANIVDELIVYLAPCLLGDQARGLVSLPGLTQLADRLAFTLIDSQPMGSDIRLTFQPNRSSPTA